MNDLDLEQKLKELARVTAPQHSMVTRVMQRVNEAREPRRSFVWGLQASQGARAVAAVVALAACVAVVAFALHAVRTPRPLPPIGLGPTDPAFDPTSDGGAAIRVMDIRRVDPKSPETLDDLLRDRASVGAPDSAIRVADVSRRDLNLY